MYSKFVFIKWNRLNTRKENSGQEINIIKTMIAIFTQTGKITGDPSNLCSSSTCFYYNLV